MMGGGGSAAPPGPKHGQEGGAELLTSPPPRGECGAPFLSRRLLLQWIAVGGAPKGPRAERRPSPVEDGRAHCWWSPRSP